MTIKVRFILLGLILGLACCWVGACRGLASLNPNTISNIESPTDLPDELREVKFHLLKRGEFGSLVAILDLGFREPQIYHNEGYLSRVDLSPNGSELIFTRMISNGDIKSIWLYWVDLKNGTEEKIAGWPTGYDQISISNPSFTPDGEGVLFSVTWYETGITGLARVQSDGTGLVILETNLPINDGPVGSPDNSLIVVVCGGFDLNSRAPGFQLCLLDPQGKYLETITRSGGGHGSYSFTPDGKTIVYTEYDFGGPIGILNKPHHRLLTFDLQSGAQTVLLEGEVVLLGFSPDGEEIVMMGKWHRNATWSIYIIRKNGANLRHLAYFDDFLEEWFAEPEP